MRGAADLEGGVRQPVGARGARSPAPAGVAGGRDEAGLKKRGSCRSSLRPLRSAACVRRLAPPALSDPPDEVTRPGPRRRWALCAVRPPFALAPVGVVRPRPPRRSGPLLTPPRHFGLLSPP